MNVILRTDHHLVTIEEDGTVTEQRAGQPGRTYPNLQEYYRMQQLPTTRWQGHCRQILESGGQVLDSLALLQRLLPLVQPAIEATERGAIVEGTTLTREQCERLMVLAAAVEAFVQAPIEGLGASPAEEITRYA